MKAINTHRGWHSGQLRVLNNRNKKRLKRIVCSSIQTTLGESTSTLNAEDMTHSHQDSSAFIIFHEIREHNHQGPLANITAPDTVPCLAS